MSGFEFKNICKQKERQIHQILHNYYVKLMGSQFSLRMKKTAPVNIHKLLLLYFLSTQNKTKTQQ